MQEFEAAVREQEANRRVDSKGHALCGCGGKAKLYQGTHGLYIIECLKCSVGTLFKPTKAEAWESWDRAMGVKGNG